MYIKYWVKYRTTCYSSKHVHKVLRYIFMSIDEINSYEGSPVASYGLWTHVWLLAVYGESKVASGARSCTSPWKNLSRTRPIHSIRISDSFLLDKLPLSDPLTTLQIEIIKFHTNSLRTPNFPISLTFLRILAVNWATMHLVEDNRQWFKLKLETAWLRWIMWKK